jgi:TetR/AcrR family transcriptional regulator
MSDQANSTRTSERDGDTERRIREAARRVFVRRGTAGARMQEIAEEAGVNQALLHYYFRSKEGLALAVFQEAAGRVAPSVAAVLASDLPIEQKVERFVQAYIDQVRQHPYLPGYILAELHHHPERIASIATGLAGRNPVELMGAFLGGLRRQLDEEAAAGTLRPMTPEQFLVNLLALVAFPFIARPVIRFAMDMDDAGFDRFLDERRATLPAFILGALRP